MGADVEAIFAHAALHHQAGRLGQAEQLYRHILTAAPHHADSLHRLGVIGLQTGQAAIAVDLISQAIVRDGARAAYHSHLSLALAELAELEAAVTSGRNAIRLEPDRPDFHKNLGVILVQCGRLTEAADCYRASLSLDPGIPDTHRNLGDVLLALEEPAAAAHSYRQALALWDGSPEAHTGLGNALLDLGHTDEAIVHHSQAVRLAPDFADAHNNLGSALWKLGKLAPAEEHLRTAIRLNARFFEAHSNLAGVLKASGRLDGAVDSLARALEIAPESPEVLSNLALTLLAQGDPGGAMSAALSGLERGDTAEGRRAFVRSARRLQLESGGEEIRPWLLRALQEAWDRPDDLARFTGDIIRSSQAVTSIIAPRASPEGQNPYSQKEFRAAVSDPLLHALLRATPNVDLALERLLTAARKRLLDTAMDGAEHDFEADLEFYAALAQQCFLNEYLFNHTDSELSRALALSDALATALDGGGAVPASWVVAVASYFPLVSIGGAKALLGRGWPAAVEAVLKQQILEPEDEQRLRDAIPCLTPIDDAASKLVQAQYEENPYPRWVHPGRSEAPQEVAAYLRQKYPFATIENPAEGAGIEVLVAGCGTGRNAIETAQKFKHARLLAIDLSLASLGHAARKSRELGIDGIEYAQADLMELGRTGRRFDFIEAVGVLHHLGDPVEGWRTLLSLLRPGGFMMVGLYSQLARRQLPDVSAETADAEPIAEAVRRARRALIDRHDAASRAVVQAADFYAVSTCRDLLFHVQEKRFTLAEIDRCLRENGMTFIGFEIDDAVLAAYRRGSPGDPGASNLGEWRRFEQENPDTFPGMYQFWIQKAGTAHCSGRTGPAAARS